MRALTNFGGLRSVGNFNGQNYIDLGTQINSNLSISNVWSASVRFRLTVGGAARTLLQSAISGADRMSMQISLLCGRATVGIYESSYIYVNSPSSLELNKWYHLLMINNAGAVSGYLNNVQFSATGSTPSSNSNPKTTIGVRTDGSNSPMIGNIANIDIWTRALNASERDQLYKGNLTGDLVSLPINENGGSIVVDYVAGKNGTWSNNSSQHAQGRGTLLSKDVFFYDSGDNWPSDNITQTQHISDYTIESGSFRGSQDSSGDYLECVSGGSFSLYGIDLENLIENGYISEISGDLSGDAGGTVSSAASIFWSNNKLIFTMTGGQKVRPPITIIRQN
jgi:hypothetical protein